MGDVSAEPSMEDILSSIKRIIAEEGDDRPVRPRRTPMRAVPSAADDEEESDEVLELSDPMPPPEARAASAPAPASAAQSAAASPADEAPATIVSKATAQATRGALENLSRLVVKPEASGDGTLEGLVREMLRPMLRDWLDANLPGMVETLVAREIAKITRGGLE